MKIKYEVSKENTYNPSFVSKVIESRKQAREGKVKRVEKKEFKNLLGPL